MITPTEQQNNKKKKKKRIGKKVMKPTEQQDYRTRRINKVRHK